MQHVGLTLRTVTLRFYEHSINRKSAIGPAIQKYGSDNFLIVVLEVCEALEKENEREKFWIAFHDCIAPNGYNRTDGGKCASSSQHVGKVKTSLFQSINNQLQTFSKDKLASTPAMTCIVSKRNSFFN